MSASRPSSSCSRAFDDAAQPLALDQRDQRQQVEVAGRVAAEGAARDRHHAVAAAGPRPPARPSPAPMLVPPTKSISMPRSAARATRPGGRSRARRRRPAPGPTAVRLCRRASRAMSRSSVGRMCTWSATGRRASQAAVPRGQRSRPACSSTRISAASVRGGRVDQALRSRSSCSTRRLRRRRPAAAVRRSGGCSGASTAWACASPSSSTKSCSASISSSSSAMRRFARRRCRCRWPRRAAPSAASSAAESTTRTRPWRASCAASRSAKPRRSTPAVTGQQRRWSPARRARRLVLGLQALDDLPRQRHRDLRAARQQLR